MKTYFRMLKWLVPHYWAVAVTLACLTVTVTLGFASLTAFLPLIDVKFASDGLATINKINILDKLPRGQDIRIWLDGFLSGDINDVTVKIAIAILLGIALKSIAEFLYNYTVAYVMNRVSMEISRDLYTHVLDQSMTFFMKKGVGSLISSFTNDVEVMRRASVIVLADVIKEPLKMLSYLCLILAIDYQLAILALAVLPVTTYIIFLMGRGTRKRSERAWEEKASLTSVLQETFDGIRLIKVFSMESREIARFWGACRNVFKHLMKIAKTRALTPPIIEMLYSTSFCIILVAALHGDAGTSEYGGFILFFGGLASLYAPLRRLSKVHMAVNEGIAAADRVFDLLDTKPDIVERPGAKDIPLLQEEITFNDVTFRYNDEEGKILKNVSFTVKKGEVTAIVGLSGEGKTTIVNLLLRFFEPDSGTICMDGMNIMDGTMRSLRRQMGMITQDVILFNDTVRNNIIYGRDSVSDEDVVAAAKVAQIDEFIMSLPKGYDTEVGEDAARFSRGQQQRIAVARAIVRAPQILVMDEATSSLDAHRSYMLFEALGEFMHKRATIVISHQLIRVKDADQILVLKEGDIISRGTHSELMDSCEFYADLYKKQEASSDGDS